jgi:uncharacterized protein YjiS (DUF1127 family)
MAYVNSTRSIDAAIADGVSNAVKNVRERFEQYQVYRTTLRELSALSGRELADLGMHRSQIRSIALDAAYGK